MNKCLSNLDSRADKQRFLEANHTAFMIPKKFDAATYQNKIDEVGLDWFMCAVNGSIIAIINTCFFLCLVCRNGLYQW